MKKAKENKDLVLGLSKSGIAAAKLLAAQDWDVYLSEKNDIAPDEHLTLYGIKIETGGHTDAFWQGASLAVASPGIPPKAEIIQKINAAGIPIISEIELAYRDGGDWIAITGTNGKTTTTALVAHIIGETPCGNYGLPPSELLVNASRLTSHVSRFVCEVSSYQLETSPTFAPKIAVWTNFAPDHLDWHDGLENYFNAKAKMFVKRHCEEAQCADEAIRKKYITGLPRSLTLAGNDENTQQYAVLNATDEKLVEFSKEIGGQVFWFGAQKGENSCYTKDSAIFFNEEKIIDLAECPLIGEHNYQNIEAAVICAKIEGVPTEQIRERIISFTPPEHRMEKFGGKSTCNGIDFYNDSKATNPEAAIVAIKSFAPSQNVVLIAGGRDKNTDLTEFCEEVKKHITTVVLIGEAAQRFEQNLRQHGFTNIKTAADMKAATDTAVGSKPDVVLLSPACASFDMFSSYEERGKVFKEYVRKYCA